MTETARVCLAISSFRNDEAVERLLETAAPLVPNLFSEVLIVDSLGTGRIPEFIARRQLRHVSYHSSPANLGSAGNLARRLELAAESSATLVYALNHDGQLVESTVRALLGAATLVPRLGAAYPLRRLPNRGGGYDVTGTSRLLRPRRTRTSPLPDAVADAYWGSSNGTLYGLEPIRAGLKPWSDLWMGWEDLGYGWLLHAHGFRQVIVRDAVFDDPYEFRPVRRGALHVTEKPSWYAYYGPRNLVLITRRLRPTWDVCASVAGRIAVECGTTLLLRRRKRERLRLIARGVVDGFAERSGRREDVHGTQASAR